MSGDLYELALSIPWQMTAQGLEAMLSIAARDPLPEDEIARRMHGPRSLALRSGERRDDSRRMTMHGSIARIPVDGPIHRYADMFTRASGGVTTESLAQDIGAAHADPKVSGILLVCDSPGGEITGVGELANVLYQMRGHKPTVAYVEGYGASAMYRIASGADLIVADSDSIIGSIGTILGVADPTKRPSYRVDFVSKQSPKKKPDLTTDAGRAVLQAMVDDLTDVFIAQVAKHRGLTGDQILEIEGGMLIGQQAIDAGLADMLGSEESALAALIGGALPIPAPRTFFSVTRGAAAKENTHMAKGFWAWMGGGPDETPATAPPALASEQSAAPPPAQTAPAARTTESDQQAQIMADNAALRAQLAKVQSETITRDAAAFVTAQIATGHAYPAEQAALVQLYTVLAEDDAAHPVTSGTSRIAQMTAAIAARPANRLAGNLLPSALPPGAVALTNQDGAGSMLDEAEQSARAYAAKANGRAK